MLRLPDARTGSPAEVRPARPGLLRVCAHLPQADAESGITALRVLLIADLLARTAELRGLQVLIALHFPGGFPLAAVESHAGALGIHPPAARTSSDDVESLLGGPVDVHLAGHGASVAPGRGGLPVSVGAAHLSGSGSHADAAAAGPLAGYGHDPLAVRLELMSFPGQRPAALTGDGLARAQETLGDWRRRVAGWAESPSGPIPARIAELARLAFGDLDTVSALALLGQLAADDSLPAGAKFETFVYADLILGLDLARDVGRY
jgi:hypothetical protein